VLIRDVADIRGSVDACHRGATERRWRRCGEDKGEFTRHSQPGTRWPGKGSLPWANGRPASGRPANGTSVR